MFSNMWEYQSAGKVMDTFDNPVDRDYDVPRSCVLRSGVSDRRLLQNILNKRKDGQRTFAEASSNISQPRPALNNKGLAADHCS